MDAQRSDSNTDIRKKVKIILSVSIRGKNGGSYDRKDNR